MSLDTLEQTISSTIVCGVGKAYPICQALTIDLGKEIIVRLRDIQGVAINVELMATPQFLIYSSGGGLNILTSFGLIVS